MQRLPGIIQIAYCQAQLLSTDVTFRALANMPVGIFTSLTTISHIGDAICEVETSFDNNDYLQKATLTFSSLESIPTDIPLAFVITTADHKQYLMGTKELPYTIIKSTTSTGSLDSDRAVTKYSISYQNTLALVSCVA